VLSKAVVESNLHITVANITTDLGACEYRTAGWTKGTGQYDIAVYPQPDAEPFYQQLLQAESTSPGFRHVSGPWKDGFYAQERGGAITMGVLTDGWAISTNLGGVHLIGEMTADRFLAELTALCTTAASALG
jgi:hypothetical protein